jgi:hypothetical protein
MYSFVSGCAHLWWEYVTEKKIINFTELFQQGPSYVYDVAVTN